MTEETTNEIWKDIPEYENLYQISSLGRVKSIQRKEKYKNFYRTRKEKILKPAKDRFGYLKVCLWKKGKMKNIKIHRLVAQAFLQNPDNLPQVNHRNEDKTDNRLENLEFCNSKYNCNFATRNKRIAKAKSIPVKCIETGVVYDSTMEAQRQLGFYHSNISYCCNKKYGFKTVGGYHWEWA